MQFLPLFSVVHAFFFILTREGDERPPSHLQIKNQFLILFYSGNFINFHQNQTINEDFPIYRVSTMNVNGEEGREGETPFKLSKILEN